MQIAKLNHIQLLILAVVALQFTFAGTAVSQSDTRIIQHRKLAPGVLIEIPSELDVRDSFSLPMPLPGIDAEKYELETDSRDATLHGMSNGVILYRDVYQYDFAFTGLRQIRVPVIDSNGLTVNRNYWYMVYRIRDTGETLSYNKVKKSQTLNQLTYELKKNEPLDDKDRLFLPRFSLEGWVYSPKAKGYEKVKFGDVVRPSVARAIRAQEDPRMPLHDPIQMSKVEIPKVKAESDVGVWGVAIFEGVNPNIDYVSVFAKGLTNAYRIKRTEDGSIGFIRKTLQLNFWRPGDRLEEDKDRIKYGIPLVDSPKEQVLIAERYALPGPIIVAYEKDATADRKVPILEADAMVNLKDFQSALVPTLDKGNLPESIVKAFANAGISVGRDVGVATLIEGNKWGFKLGKRDIELALEPQFWAPDFEGIRFIKSLDSIWIYR